MASKAVILKTDDGIKIIGTIQCSNGAWFDADGCFNYCQSGKTDFDKKHQSQKLKCASTSLGKEKENSDWYNHRENFIDIEIPFDCIQTYDGGST